jgi:hypothetical protein
MYNCIALVYEFSCHVQFSTITAFLNSQTSINLPGLAVYFMSVADFPVAHFGLIQTQFCLLCPI